MTLKSWAILGGVYLQLECHSQYVANLTANGFVRKAPQPDAVAANPEEVPVFPWTCLVLDSDFEMRILCKGPK